MAKITKEMGIMEIVQAYPETIEVFQRFGMGCIGCAAARFENLEAGAKVHGIDIDAMVDAMNDVVESSAEVRSSYIEETIYDESTYENESTEEVKLYYDVPLSDDLQDYILEVCEGYGVNHLVVLAMIKKESAFNSASVGDNGNSFGLMQIQPRWHQQRMNELGVTDLLDPYQNILVGVDYLADMLAYEKGLEWALMAYNGGPTYANRKLAAGEVNKYTKSVLEYTMNFERR